MSCCCTTVETGSVKILERCGAFTGILQPGLNFIVPCIDVPSNPISMRLQQIEVSCETKTKDNVFTQMKVSIQFQIVKEDDKIHASYYRLSNPRKQIEAYVYDVVRSSVPKIKLDDVFTTKDEISANIKRELTESMSDYGFYIQATPITDIDPAQDVKMAMNEINKQQRLRVAATDEGEANKIRVLKMAEAEAGQTKIQAEAEAEAKYLAGTGIARQRQAIMNGLRESVLHFNEGVSDIDTKSVMDMMVLTQYMDTLKDIGAQDKSHTVFIPHSAQAVGDIASQIRDGVMQGAQAQGMRR